MSTWRIVNRCQLGVLPINVNQAAVSIGVNLACLQSMSTRCIANGRQLGVLSTWCVANWCQLGVLPIGVNLVRFQVLSAWSEGIRL